MPKNSVLITTERLCADGSPPPGAYMKDPTGCVVFVSARHDANVVNERLAAGWELADSGDAAPAGTEFHETKDPE